MDIDPSHVLTTAEQVADVLGTPADFVVGKIGDHVDDATAEFIGRSPLAFVATHDSDGRADVSPKGDAAGFVHVADPTTLLIPERKGNKLAFGIRNILDTGRIGLIFVVPGMRNGTATISTEPALLERLAAKDKPALLCTVVQVEESFFHCGKAMIRSKLWDTDTWDDTGDSLIAKQLAGAMGDAELEPVVNDLLEQDYVDELY